MHIYMHIYTHRRATPAIVASHITHASAGDYHTLAVDTEQRLYI